MKSRIVFVKSVNEDVDSIEFFKRAYAIPELIDDFIIARIGAQNIQDILRDWIIEDGISSLFNYHVTCDSVLHPGIHVDEIENLILSFLKKLTGSKDLFIIDPFIYSSEPSVLQLFGKMISEISDTLSCITFFSKRVSHNHRLPMHRILRGLIPNIKIRDIETELFHDRFWIDADSKKGIVMGTSLNGITKKICLIDYLNYSDSAQLIEMAQKLIKK